MTEVSKSNLFSISFVIVIVSFVFGFWDSQHPLGYKLLMVLYDKIYRPKVVFDILYIFFFLIFTQRMYPFLTFWRGFLRVGNLDDPFLKVRRWNLYRYITFVKYIFLAFLSYSYYRVVYLLQLFLCLEKFSSFVFKPVTFNVITLPF